MSAPVIISFREVSFSYNGEPVLVDVTLDIRRGEFVSVVGPNGGGKTSLLLLALGLLKPGTGTVRVFGNPPERERTRMGYVPQFIRFDPLFPVTVLDVVQMGRLGRSFTGPYGKEDLAATVGALEQVGMADLRDRPFADLSGGQRQRMLIARALASEPEVLMLDEPTANVDRLGTAKLYELLLELNRRLTILLVSHDVGVVSRHVSNVVCVNRTVVMHPIGELTGDMIRELYGGEIAMVRHDTRSPQEG
jgi:zinc transport system ATP-binding protein